MPLLKEVNVYTNGAAHRLSTFSNVPYFFIETLKSNGVKVNPINIEPNANWGKIWNRFALRFIRIFIPGSMYSFDRTLINEWYMRKIIKKAVQDYPEAEAHIFLTFIAHAKGFSKAPSILISDWNYEYVIEHFWEKKPDFLQKRAIKRQDKILEEADHLFFLFPGSMRKMKEKYKNPNIHLLGNFVNCLDLPQPEWEVLHKKTQSHDLLFIGKDHYKAGAITLLKAFAEIRKKYPDLTLHIIGMDSRNFEPIPESIIFYGYLDKEKEEQRKTFYDLLSRARVFINTTPKWGAYSATLEALFYYNPVVVAPYDEFLENFGENLDFGLYCPKNDPELLEKLILEILESPHYSQLCLNARKTAQDFTWDQVCTHLFHEIGFKLGQ
jgi:glycosyltransferase involved in cell wall biosynthesis